MLKRLVYGAVAFLSVAATASAAPLDLQPGPVYIQFNNIEQLNTANNLVVPGYTGDGSCTAANPCGNWGLFNVSTVQAGFAIPVPPRSDISGGPPYFTDAGVNGQITGIFYGIDLLPTFNDGLTTHFDATGGTIDLYWQEGHADPIDNVCLAGVDCLPDAATVARFTSGTFLARVNFATGIHAFNHPNGSPITIHSQTDPTVQGGLGLAEGFGNVNLAAGGEWALTLDQDWFFVDLDGDGIRGEPGETRDIRFATIFNVTLDSWDGPGGTVGLRSNDPARGFAPEPATLAMFGIGLATLAAHRRRRMRQSRS
jgi:hypothetical protein